MRKPRRNKKNEGPKTFPAIVCKFPSFEIQAIKSMAFNESSNLLLIARNPGNYIELWSTIGWISLAVYRLDANFPLRKVHWKDSNEFIATTMNGFIIMFGVEQGEISKSDCYSDVIWNSDLKGELLATSHEDGGVKIWNMEEKPVLNAVTSKYEKRCLCVHWVNENELWASYQDETIRQFNSKGQLVTSIKLPNSFGWCLSSIDNMVLVGTHCGSLYVINRVKGGILQELDIMLGAILCIEVSSSGVFASGADARIAFLNKTGNKLNLSLYDRGHSHDTNALQIINSTTLISGGMNGEICFYNLMEYSLLGRLPKTKVKRLHNPSSCLKAEIGDGKPSELRIAFLKPFSIEIWSLRQSIPQFETQILSGNSCIKTMDLSNCGKFLAYSTNNSTSIYQISEDFSLLKVIDDLPASTILKFNENSSRLTFIPINSNFAFYMNLAKLECKPKLFIELDNYLYDSIVYSPNTKLILFFSKVANSIEGYERKKKKKLPALPNINKESRIVSLAFADNSGTFVVLYENNKWFVFNSSNFQLNCYSKEHIGLFPKNLEELPKTFNGTIFLSTSILMFSTDYYMVVRKSDKWRKEVRHVRRPIDGRAYKSLLTFERKNILLDMKKLRNNRVLIIEVDFNRMVDSLPNAVKSKKYGF